MEEAGIDPVKLLGRHLRGDWGDVSEQDAAENAFSLGKHLRIWSAYILPTGGKVWVITNANRSATTFMLPSDY
jgi:hypothetical protein